MIEKYFCLVRHAIWNWKKHQHMTLLFFKKNVVLVNGLLIDWQASSKACDLTLQTQNPRSVFKVKYSISVMWRFFFSLNFEISRSPQRRSKYSFVFYILCSSRIPFFYFLYIPAFFHDQCYLSSGAERFQRESLNRQPSSRPRTGTSALRIFTKKLKCLFLLL